MFGSRRALKYPAKVITVASGNLAAPGSTKAGVIALQVATNQVRVMAATGTGVVGAAVTVATSTFK